MNRTRGTLLFGLGAILALLAVAALAQGKQTQRSKQSLQVKAATPEVCTAVLAARPANPAEYSKLSDDVLNQLRTAEVLCLVELSRDREFAVRIVEQRVDSENEAGKRFGTKIIEGMLALWQERTNKMSDGIRDEWQRSENEHIDRYNALVRQYNELAATTQRLAAQGSVQASPVQAQTQTTRASRVAEFLQNWTRDFSNQMQENAKRQREAADRWRESILNRPIPANRSVHCVSTQMGDTTVTNCN